MRVVCLVISKISLQSLAKPDLSFVVAVSFHAFRYNSKAFLTALRSTSGNLSRQLSYFSRYSSHSGIPILSRLAVVSVFVVSAGVFVVSAGVVVLEVLFVLGAMPESFAFIGLVPFLQPVSPITLSRAAITIVAKTNCFCRFDLFCFFILI